MTTWITAQEAADILGIRPGQAQGLIGLVGFRTIQLDPTHRTERSWQFDRADVEALPYRGELARRIIEARSWIASQDAGMDERIPSGRGETWGKP